MCFPLLTTVKNVWSEYPCHHLQHCEIPIFLDTSNHLYSLLPWTDIKCSKPIIPTISSTSAGSSDLTSALPSIFSFTCDSTCDSTSTVDSSSVCDSEISHAVSISYSCFTTAYCYFKCKFNRAKLVPLISVIYPLPNPTLSLTLNFLLPPLSLLPFLPKFMLSPSLLKRVSWVQIRDYSLSIIHFCAIIWVYNGS